MKMSKDESLRILPAPFGAGLTPIQRSQDRKGLLRETEPINIVTFNVITPHWGFFWKHF